MMMFPHRLCFVLVIQVFAGGLNTYFQLTVMLMLLLVGLTLLQLLSPFENQRSQLLQVSMHITYSKHLYQCGSKIKTCYFTCTA